MVTSRFKTVTLHAPDRFIQLLSRTIVLGYFIQVGSKCSKDNGGPGASSDCDRGPQPQNRQIHTTLLCLSLAISSAEKPNSARISSVCSPNSGGRAAILLGVRDNVKGWPTRRM